jgi:hypothetical protein
MVHCVNDSKEELYRFQNDEIDAHTGYVRIYGQGEVEEIMGLFVRGKQTIDLPGTWVLQPADCEQIDLSSLVLESLFC